jgi:cytochrome c556
MPLSKNDGGFFMLNISMETFDKEVLESLNTSLTGRLESLHKDFNSAVEPINGYFGYLSAEVAKGLPNWSQNVLDHISSSAEAKIYKKAGLKGGELNGREVLLREIDPYLVDADGYSNLQKMERGRAPIDADGQKIDLHHIGKKSDSPLAELSKREHMGDPNYKVLHGEKETSTIDRNAFNKEREQHWKERAATIKAEQSFSGIVRTSTDAGVKSGLTAAGLTLAISTVDNARGVIAGEITAQEAFVDVAVDTGTAGAVGFGVGFVSTAVSQTMKASSSTLLRSLGNANVPAAVIAFGIDSCDSIVDYAHGDINGAKLATDLGESAVGVAGSIGGAALAGAAVGSVVPGAGTAVGFATGLVGSMVGYAVAIGAYATAVEFAQENAEAFKTKAAEMGRGVIDTVASSAPEAVDNVRTAMNNFAANLGVSCNL